MDLQSFNMSGIITNTISTITLWKVSACMHLCTQRHRKMYWAGGILIQHSYLQEKDFVCPQNGVLSPYTKSGFMCQSAGELTSCLVASLPFSINCNRQILLSLPWGSAKIQQNSIFFFFKANI